MGTEEPTAPRAPWSVPLRVWSALVVVVVSIQHLSNRVLRDPAWQWDGWVSFPYHFDGLRQYDGVHYTEIAEHGYRYTEGVQSTVVWFPLYPWSMRAVTPLVGSTLAAGIAISLVASAGALVLYDRWTRGQGIGGTARWAALLCLAVYPYSWFLYGAVYADALFLLLVLGALLTASGGHRGWAALIGALATATRPTALALVPALVVMAATADGVLGPARSRAFDAARGRFARMAQWGAASVALPSYVRLRRSRPATAVPLLALGGVVGFATYLGQRFGDPWIFLTNQRTYHHTDLLLFKYGFFWNWAHRSENPIYTYSTTLQAFICLAVLALSPAVARRFGFAYGVYTAALATFPIVGTSDFMGAGRYLTAAFPTFALVGEWLATRPRIWAVALATSTALFALGTFGFSRSWYLS